MRRSAAGRWAVMAKFIDDMTRDGVPMEFVRRAVCEEECTSRGLDYGSAVESGHSDLTIMRHLMEADEVSYNQETREFSDAVQERPDDYSRHDLRDGERVESDFEGTSEPERPWEHHGGLSYAPGKSDEQRAFELEKSRQEMEAANAALAQFSPDEIGDDLDASVTQSSMERQGY